MNPVIHGFKRLFWLLVGKWIQQGSDCKQRSDALLESYAPEVQTEVRTLLKMHIFPKVHVHSSTASKTYFSLKVTV